jgi:hypothetical protein
MSIEVSSYKEFFRYGHTTDKCLTAPRTTS